MTFHISLLTPHGAELKFYSALEVLFMPTLARYLSQKCSVMFIEFATEQTPIRS